MKVKKSAKILNISILIILCIILFSGCSTKDISKSNLYDNINNDSYSISSENKSYNKDEGGAVSSHSFNSSKNTDLSEENSNSDTNNQQSNTKIPSEDMSSNSEQNVMPEQNGTSNTSNSPANDNHENLDTSSQNTINNESQTTQQIPDTQNNPSSTENEGSDSSNYCSFIVECNKAFESTELSQSLRDVLPKDGIIYSGNPKFNQGESVFDLLKRLMKENGIPLEFSSSPAYGSKYIEGINSLHEFDCGELSGWTYFVNGSRPSYGCDKYIIRPGDDIRWYYTCNLGNDI